MDHYVCGGCEEHTAVCPRCKRYMNPLEVFPGGICIACHDEAWEPDGKVPDFTRGLSLRVR